MELWRVNWQSTGQRVLMRRGAIGEAPRKVKFRGRDPQPRICWARPWAGCFRAAYDAALGDARCRVDLDSPAFTGSGQVADLLRDRAFIATGLSGFASGWFAFGSLTLVQRRQYRKVGRDRAA